MPRDLCRRRDIQAHNSASGGLKHQEVPSIHNRAGARMNSVTVAVCPGPGRAKPAQGEEGRHETQPLAEALLTLAAAGRGEVSVFFSEVTPGRLTTNQGRRQSQD